MDKETIETRIATFLGLLLVSVFVSAAIRTAITPVPVNGIPVSDAQWLAIYNQEHPQPLPPNVLVLPSHPGTPG